MITKHKHKGRPTFATKMKGNIHLLNISDAIKFLSKKDYFFMASSHVEKFTGLFGKRDGLLRREYNISYWQLDFKGCRFTIFSGKGKGTSYEVSGHPKPGLCSEFLKKIHDLLKET